MTGLPKTVILTPEEIRFAIEDVVSSIVASVIRCLAKAPPELSQDFLPAACTSSAVAACCAASASGSSVRPVSRSGSRPPPLEAVVLGAGHVIEHYEALKGMFMGARR